MTLIETTASSASRHPPEGRLVKLRPDAPRTFDRFEAWWCGELIDRPPMTLSVRPAQPYAGPLSNHASLRHRWMDAPFQVESAIARLEQQEFAGDALPLLMPSIGPELSATLWRCELEFSENTSWSVPVIRDSGDWDRIIGGSPDFHNPYWQTIERMVDLAIAACDGRYLVGIPDLHGNYDILAALRDPEPLCLDLIDDPQRVRRAGRRVSAGYVAAFNRLYGRISAAGFGSTTWAPFWHDGPAYLPSCDFWCIVSDTIAREWILPDILIEMRPLQRSLFHLDGPQALRHLDLLLEIPHLSAVQWVYGAGNGPAARWIDVYRRILDAHKSVHVLAADAADALAVLDSLGPAGVWLQVQRPFASLKRANDFVDEIARMCRTSAGSTAT